MKKIITIVFLIFVIAAADSHAGLFGSKIPQGKEIKDAYLEKLFAPDFPYESIKVIDTNKGKRYVIIKAKEAVTDKIRFNYENNFLLKRGIVVYNSGNPRTKELLISQMRLYRTASEKPYVIEYCQSEGDVEYEFQLVESVVRNKGKYIIILINKNFGKVFKQIEIYPEKEANCPEPPFVGKYPNSRCLSYHEFKNKKGIAFFYISKDKAENIYNFYRDRLKKHYKITCSNYPEKAWSILNGFGMGISLTEVVNSGIEYSKNYNPLASPPPR